MPVTRRELEAVALNEKEYRLIVERLGREPNHLELGIFGAMWSEHCGYKHSRPLLRGFPRRSEHAQVLIEAGEENAGAVDIGDGLAIIMKVESHNHPSAVEPYEGAATGVGGIVRDIFTMGARPIALLNSLRFGPLDDPRSRFLFKGVVAGISGYGNCLGIPDVGGEIQFGPSYRGNPLVNAMCVGLVRHDEIVRARASGVGNSLMLVGSDTGRDGIHGATFASVELDDRSAERRPAVQVGNPFMEKLLLEACLELLRSDDVVGLQDLGAAGLTSSVVEAAEKGGSGVEIDVSCVPRRERGMSPYEVMLSESQERMLVVAKAGHEDAVSRLFDRWGLHAEVIGTVTASGRILIRDGSDIVADLPIEPLTDAPSYRYDVVEPGWLRELQGRDFHDLRPLSSESSVPLASTPVSPAAMPTAGEALLALLGSPNVCSRRPVFRQYDHQVQNNTVIVPGRGDAAVLRIKGTTRGIALAIDGNGRQCYLDPFAGGAMAVAEAARNVVCSGATPVALTDCLNFGNPERPDVYFQLSEAIAGMSAACQALGIPVISGNVSLYNESGEGAVHPTPVVGMLGVLDDIERRLDAAFRDEGDAVVLLGANEIGLNTLAGSEFLELVHGQVAGRPAIDLDGEVRLQRAVLAMVAQGVLKSAHDCAEGGLAVAISESAILGGVGVQADLDLPERCEGPLFGEAPSRIVVSTAPEHLDRVLKLAADCQVPALKIARVGGNRIRFAGAIDVPLAEAAAAWEGGLVV